MALSSVQFLISAGMGPCRLFWCRALKEETGDLRPVHMHPLNGGFVEVVKKIKSYSLCSLVSLPMLGEMMPPSCM